MAIKKFCIIGGDERYKKLALSLYEDGYKVKVYGSSVTADAPFKNSNSYAKALYGSNIVICPIPFSKDGENIFLPDSANSVNIDNLFESMSNYKITTLFGGVISAEIKEKAKTYGITATDIIENDGMSIANAIPTAEGALQIAMQESSITVSQSNCIVLGYGRCGKVLANMLKGIGANVSATYRKDSDCALIKAFGNTPVALSTLKENIHKYDFIFNTIPSEVLTADIIEQADCKSIIIDLAQAPGGVDYQAAKEKNIKALFCPGLPGIVAPDTASSIIKEAILNSLGKS